MKNLKKILRFCIRHQTILGCSTVSLLTAATAEIFSFAVFQCPCNHWNLLYGSSFLLAPAFILFLLGFMVDLRTWRLLTGKCSPEKHPKCSPCGTCASFCQLWVPMTTRTLVAPLTWMAVALFGANYYECAASGSSLMERFYCKDNGTECRNQLLKMPCDENISAKISSERLSLHAQSQLIGWFLIAGIMTMVLLSACVSHCSSRVSYIQFKFWKFYSKKECELFKSKAKKHATQLAERNTNSFFEATDPAPFPTPSKKEWKKISIVSTLNPQEQHCSTTDDVNTNRGNSAKFTEEHQNHTASRPADEAQNGIGGS